MIGSPTALADKDLEDSLKASIEKHGNGLYVPSGALWGGEDIRKMADRGSLKVRFWLGKKEIFWFCDQHRECLGKMLTR